MFLVPLVVLALLTVSTKASKSLRSSHFGIPGQDASFDYVGPWPPFFSAQVTR